MDINTKNRADLKAYFVKNAIPTEGNFADLINGMLNPKEDGLVKSAGAPLSIEAAGAADAANEKRAVNFFSSLGDANPAWSISLNPRSDLRDAKTARAAFSISDGAGNSRLAIDATTGYVGIGTTAPLYRLHAVNSGGFGPETATGTSLAGNVPLIAQSSSTAFGIINGNGRQAFALNIDGDGGATNTRGVPTFFDKYDGAWHPSIYLKNGNVGIGTASPNEKLVVNGELRMIDSTIWLRTGADTNHGVGWFGGNRPFATTNVDGPVVFGFSGGVLGTTNGGQRS